MAGIKIFHVLIYLLSVCISVIT